MIYCYFNGQLVAEDKASIPVNQIGITRGFGIFDFFRLRDGKPTFLEEHLDRFDRSQKFMALSQMITRDEIKQAIEDLIRKNGMKESGFKLLLYGDGSDADPILKPFFYITQTSFENHRRSEVGNLIMYEYLREFPEVKSVNYLANFLVHQRRVAANAIDVLFHKDGLVSEGARSSVFIVKEGVLKTPAKNILGSITRMQVLKVAPAILPVEVGEVSLDELKSADEIFLASSIKEVMGIVKLEDTIIGNGKMGSFTQKLQSAFRSLF